MSIESANLSPHVLGYIFSYLPPEDLSRAAQVSKSWNTVSKSDDLWRNLAQSILDLSEPAQGSWKEQYKILHRWKTWDSQETTLIPSSFESTLLLQGTTVFELTEDSTQPFLYSMHNLLTHEKVYTINLKEHGCAAVSAKQQQGSMWMIRDVNGHIFQFDLKTGLCTNDFIGADIPAQYDRSVLYCNDNEIITSVNDRVQIWNLNEHQLSQTFTIKEGYRIRNICSTPNFIVCLSCDSEDSIFAINKKDPTIQTKIEVGSNVEGIHLGSSGHYCAMLSYDSAKFSTELYVYEDTPDGQFQLTQTHQIGGAYGYADGQMQMYRNWACVRNGYAFYIFDVRNGREKVSHFIDGDPAWWLHVTSETLLLTQIVAMENIAETHPKCSLYDFSRTERQIDSTT